MDDRNAVVERTTSPDDAFGLLTDETRLGIVRALQDADEPRSFSQLRETVGVRDSGKFNYHLDKLTDQFVRKTEEGYELTHAGFRVVAAILSGVYTHATRLDPVPVDGECFDCGGDLELRSENDEMAVACTDCEVAVLSHPVPPVVLQGRDPESLPAAFEGWVRANFDQVRRGFCPHCGGAIDHQLQSIEIEWGEMAGVVSRCEVCGIDRTSSVGAMLLEHPSVVAFHHERGVDLRETPIWELDWLGDYGTLDSESPPRATVAVELDGDVLEVTVDEDLDVVETRRP